MTDLELALRYAPLIHYDIDETIPLRKVGYTIFREGRRSDSFPKREVVPEKGGFVIEYALFWDYDIQHMYDLEHIWVYVTQERVTRAEGSFHGKYLTLWEEGMPFALPVEEGHVHAFCQPGKHAFLPHGQLFRLIPGWRECCGELAGGAVLVGGPFASLYQPTPEDDQRCARYIRENLTFTPSLVFTAGQRLEDAALCSWEDLKAWIPRRIAELCEARGSAL
ncbi:MAG: hypothetical protein IJ438_02980 [Clostridia bacterium]|nr:hypothetical protein [Clostridia bacterium]